MKKRWEELMFCFYYLVSISKTESDFQKGKGLFYCFIKP
jgi:hypothetical protein